MLGLFNSVVSAFYYARVLRAMFLRPARADDSTGTQTAAPWAISATITFATIVAVGCGVYARPLVRDTVAAAHSRLFLVGGRMSREPVRPTAKPMGRVIRPGPGASPQATR